MKQILTVFKKEFTDTLRDRRTLMSMLLAPLILYPLMMIVFAKFSTSQQEKSMEKVLKVAVYDAGNAASSLVNDLEGDEKVEVIDLPPAVEKALVNDDAAAADSLIAQAIRSEELDIVLVFPAQFADALAQNLPGEVDFYFNAKTMDIVKNRMERKLDMFEEIILNKRFAAQGLDRSFAQGLKVDEKNVATKQEILGEVVGGFLPYIFIILCFTGSMYPAIDLAAGEKERGTIETILTSPVSKLHLVLGKIGVIMITGLTSAILALLSIFLSINLTDVIPLAINDIVATLASTRTLILLILMLIPMALLFASILISLSIYAKSYKEAQSVITPMLILIIFPAFVGLMPGVELDVTTALVPILNISLVTKQILAGTLSMPLFLLTVASQFVLAGIVTWFSIQWFGREQVLLR